MPRSDSTSVSLTGAALALASIFGFLLLPSPILPEKGQVVLYTAGCQLAHLAGMATQPAASGLCTVAAYVHFVSLDQIELKQFQSDDKCVGLILPASAVAGFSPAQH